MNLGLNNLNWLEGEEKVADKLIVVDQVTGCLPSHEQVFSSGPSDKVNSVNRRPKSRGRRKKNKAKRVVRYGDSMLEDITVRDQRNANLKRISYIEAKVIANKCKTLGLNFGVSDVKVIWEIFKSFSNS